jgi:hypothetical protein
MDMAVGDQDARQPSTCDYSNLSFPQVRKPASFWMPGPVALDNFTEIRLLANANRSKLSRCFLHDATAMNLTG